MISSSDCMGPPPSQLPVQSTANANHGNSASMHVVYGPISGGAHRSGEGEGARLSLASDLFFWTRKVEIVCEQPLAQQEMCNRNLDRTFSSDVGDF